MNLLIKYGFHVFLFHIFFISYSVIALVTEYTRRSNILGARYMMYQGKGTKKIWKISSKKREKKRLHTPKMEYE